jgi:DNA-binding response OmpR family regulator
MPDGVAILTIEDELAVQFFLTEALTYAGYQVTAAESAEEALACLSIGSFSLAIVDLGLPGLGGLELLPILQARWSEMVPIVLSAYDARDTAILALESGAYDFISKPCTTAELREAVRVALDAAACRQRRQQMLTLLERNPHASVAAVRQIVVAESTPTP